MLEYYSATVGMLRINLLKQYQLFDMSETFYFAISCKVTDMLMITSFKQARIIRSFMV